MLTLKSALYFCFILFASDCSEDIQVKTYTTNQLIGKTPPELFGKDFKLQKEAFIAFEKMQKAALKDSIQIKVVSSFRSYDHQNRIWKSKFKRYTKQGLSPTEAIAKIIEYSTIPGTSRHHWATDIDIVDGNIKAPSEDVLQAQYFNNPKIYGKLKTWLDTHANTYGFYLVYTDDAQRKGFKYEPWHYSYAAISKPMLAAYKKLDIVKILQEYKLVGSAHLTPKFMKSYRETHVMGVADYLKEN